MRPFIAICFFFALCHPVAGGPEIRVSPPSKLVPNSIDAAFKKLAGARAAGDRSPATVLIEPGFYSLGTPIVLSPQLVGDGLTIKATNPASNPPILSAGVAIEWNPSPTPASPHLKTAVLEQEPAALYQNGHLLARARQPNRDYWRIEKAGPDRRTSFTWQPGTITPVTDLAHLDLVFLHDWSTSRVPVKALDPATRTLTAGASIGPKAKHYRIDHFEKHPRFFLEGSRDFLDQPGEWHYDRKKKLLSSLAMKDQKASCVATALPHVLQLRGTAEQPLRNLRIEGIQFSHANWHSAGNRYAAGQASFHEDGNSRSRKPIPCSVEAEFCKDLTFSSCQFSQSATGGLRIGQGCEKVVISNCKFHHLFANGLMIGQPEPPKHVADQVSVEKCLIEHCGEKYFGSVGLWIGMAANCTVKNNEIRNLPYTGVSVGWRWDPQPTACKGHLIVDNHIHHIMQTLSDGGGIYTLGRQPGTVLRGNHIHHVSINAGRAESNGIFMDEGTTDLVVENNHIHDIARSPIRFHRAGKNLLRKNKLVPNEGIPSLRFNSTPEENIRVE